MIRVSDLESAEGFVDQPLLQYGYFIFTANTKSLVPMILNFYPEMLIYCNNMIYNAVKISQKYKPPGVIENLELSSVNFIKSYQNLIITSYNGLGKLNSNNNVEFIPYLLYKNLIMYE